MSQPLPYDLSNPAEMQRLIRETISYLQVSLDDGTDHEGKQFVLDAWKTFCAESLRCGGACPLVYELRENFVELQNAARKVILNARCCSGSTFVPEEFVVDAGWLEGLRAVIEKKEMRK